MAAGVYGEAWVLCDTHLPLSDQTWDGGLRAAHVAVVVGTFTLRNSKASGLEKTFICIGIKHC